MNYYEHHLGDYLRDTAHLSMLEDGAYRRLIDAYYIREEPFADDRHAVHKLARAISKQEKAAVDYVLREFFIYQEGSGWLHKRCEEEIGRYRQGAPEREARKANEDNRQRKHRAERSQLFKVLTDAGHHAAWNISMEDLRNLVSTLQLSAPATAPVTAPATAPVTQPETLIDGPETGNATAPATLATATQTPDTRHQTPVLNKTIHTPPSAGPPATAAVLLVKDLIAEGVDPDVAGDWLKLRKAKKAPLTPTAWKGFKREAKLAGLSAGEAVKTATENNWAGFKAEWLTERVGKQKAAPDQFAGAL